MKSAKDIEQALAQAEMDVEINTATDRVVLDKLLQAPGHRLQNPRRVSMRSSTLGLAAAIAIVAIAALLIDHGVPRDPAHTGTAPRTETRIEKVNAIAVNMAYRRGGMDAVEELYRRSSMGSKFRPVRLSVEKLLTQLAENDDS